MNTIADDVIVNPDKFLLNANDLYEAEGGFAGLSIQVLGMLIGVGSVFAASPRISLYWKNGSMKWMEWAVLGGAGAAGYFGAQAIGLNMFGNSVKYQSHWMAYGFVKSANRWEGRQILAKPPMMY